jgi:hypothetical protein
MPLARTASYLILSVVVTIPLLFGARHPVVEGFFTFVILVGCGGWLLLATPSYRAKNVLPWLFIPLLLVAYLVAQSLPLPLSIIELISPQRADRIAMVNELAGTALIRVSISDNGLYGFYRSFFLIALILFFSPRSPCSGITNDFSRPLHLVLWRSVYSRRCTALCSFSSRRSVYSGCN